MRPEESCRLILEECRGEGAADAIASVTEIEESMIRFSNNQITVSNHLRETLASIFAMANGGKAGTTIADLSKRAIRKATIKAVSEARASPSSGYHHPLPRGPFEYSTKLIRQPLVDLEPDKLVGWVEGSVEAAREEGADRVAGSLIARRMRTTMKTSGNAHGTFDRSTLELSIRAFRGTGSGHSVSVAASEGEFDPLSAGREAGRLARASEGPSDGSPGRQTAVLGPMVFADVVSQVGRLASAFYVDAGLSFLAERLGEQVASPMITLVDDGTISKAYGSSPFDMEGSPTTRTPIVKEGILKSYLHNSDTAGRMEATNTANAGLINPRPFNLVVSPGKGDVEDLIGGVDQGIYVTNDWYLRYQNWRTGDFSMIPRDAMFTIRNGEIDRPIKDLRISDNVLRMMQGVSSLSERRKWIKWWEVDIPTLCPAAVVEGTNFTKSTM